ncbi:MAG TPA: SDR family NAD(P)-dependent oxidoreductase [Terriglobia bacterium]|nr:SDR family NAD(P)-dependent oxidoreductase [Terriglobia bacterium]
MSAEGKWAIVTGASSGIGRALALECAAAGFDVVLTGRNEQALVEVARECSDRSRVKTDIIVAELARADSTDQLISRLAGQTRRYEILVNNAGFGINGTFADTDIGSEVDLLNVQLAAALKLTKAILPAMIARRSGRILNVGSVYCYAPVPFQSVYSACKAFLLSFSAAIRNELEGTGVTVTVFCPGITQTEFRTRAGIAEKNKNSGMTAAAAARIAFGETMRGKAVVIPGAENRLFVVLAKLLPNTAFTSIIRYINQKRGHKNG